MADDRYQLVIVCMGDTGCDGSWSCSNAGLIDAVDHFHCFQTLLAAIPHSRARSLLRN